MPEIPDDVIKMFEAGATSKHVHERLRISKADALAMKKAWLDAKAPAKPAKPAKAPKEPKA